MVKHLPVNAGDPGLIPGSGTFPWRWKWQPTPIFLPGKSHGQRSPVGYSPWGHKTVEHDLATKRTHTHTHTRYSLQCDKIVKNPASLTQFGPLGHRFASSVSSDNFL